MTDLASSDVTVSWSVRNQDIARKGMAKVMTIADVTFGDGALTYPTGGVPMPAIGNFGMTRQLDFVGVEQPPANGFIYKFDRANHKLKIFAQGMTMGTTEEAIADTDVAFKPLDSAGAENTIEIPKASTGEVVDLGAMIELPSAVAPAAATVRLLVIGE